MNAALPQRITTDQKDNKSASAWILKVSEQHSVAISQYEMNHIEDSGEFYKIPKAPAWCDNIMLWKNQIVPVIDFTQLLSDKTLLETANKQSSMVAIIRLFYGTDKVASYGAIKILQPPVLEGVQNHQACQKEDIPNQLSDVSLAAFKYQEQAVVPILDIQKIFSGAVKE